jgi:hypothetical protein
VSCGKEVDLTLAGQGLATKFWDEWDPCGLDQRTVPGGKVVYPTLVPDFFRSRTNCAHAITMVERVPAALMTAVTVAREVELFEGGTEPRAPG